MPCLPCPFLDSLELPQPRATEVGTLLQEQFDKGKVAKVPGLSEEKIHQTPRSEGYLFGGWPPNASVLSLFWLFFGMFTVGYLHDTPMSNMN